MADFLSFVNTNFKWISGISYLAFIGLLAWFNQRFTPRKEHEVVKAQVSEHGKQLTQLEADMKHLPSQDEVKRLDRTLSGLTETIKATQDGINRLERKTDILLENELRND